MKPGDEYLAKALEFLAKAETENSPLMSAEFENLAAAYLRLATIRTAALLSSFK
jgi:hypothetical protein